MGLRAADLNAGRSGSAVVHLTTALEQARPLDDNWLVAMGLGLLGMVHHGQGRHDDAPACFTTARAHAETNGRPRVISRALVCLADVHLELGHYGEAKALLRPAAELMQRAGDVFLHALTLTRLGTAEHGEGNLTAATAVHHQALSQYRKLSPVTEPHYDRLEMHIRYRLGRTYSAAGRIAEAREQFRTALALPGADAHPPNAPRHWQAWRSARAGEGGGGEGVGGAPAGLEPSHSRYAGPFACESAPGGVSRRLPRRVRMPIAGRRTALACRDVRRRQFGAPRTPSGERSDLLRPVFTLSS